MSGPSNMLISLPKSPSLQYQHGSHPHHLQASAQINVSVTKRLTLTNLLKRNLPPNSSSPLSLLYFLSRIYYLTYHMFSYLSYLLFVSPTKMYDSVRVKNCICFVHSYPQHLNQWLTHSSKCLWNEWNQSQKFRDIKMKEWSWRCEINHMSYSDSY